MPVQACKEIVLPLPLPNVALCYSLINIQVVVSFLLVYQMFYIILNRTECSTQILSPKSVRLRVLNVFRAYSTLKNDKRY
jgi:hypothetical protein